MATFPGSDSGVMRTTLRYTSISQNPDDSRADPPIPGAPQWDNKVYTDENLDVIPDPYEINPYIYIPLIFSQRSWIGCAGRAGIGTTPLFHAGACGSTVAQEAAHSIGRNHACPEVPCAHNEEEGGGWDPAYPGAHGEVEPHAFGFDIFNLRAIEPETGTGHTHDFMSYGANPWVSIYTWEAIADIFDAPGIEVRSVPAIALASYRSGPASAPTSQSEAPLSTLLRVSGRIGPDQAVTLDPSFLVAASESVIASPGSGPYRLELQGRGDDTLFSANFQTAVHTHSSADEPAEFYQLVPLTEDVRQVVIFQGETELARFPVSNRAPTVEILEPVAGARWAAEGQASVVWEASDRNRDDSLLYRVEASADGSRWYVLASGITDTQTTIDLRTIPGGGDGWTLRVQASDGFNVATAEVGPLSIDSKPPQPLILHPADGAFFGVGRTVSLLGQGFDWADGPLGNESLTWQLDGNVVGTGAALEVAGLEAGEHVVTLVATNAEASTGATEVHITVGEDLDYDGLPDEWELANGLDPSDPTDAASDSDGDTLRNWQERSYGTDPFSTDTDGDGLDDAAEIEAASDPLDAASASLEGDHGEAHSARPSTVSARAPEAEEGSGPIGWIFGVGAVIVAAGAGVFVLIRRRSRGKAA
jgi:hypothetical protein